MVPRLTSGLTVLHTTLMCDIAAAVTVELGMNLGENLMLTVAKKNILEVVKNLDLVNSTRYAVH